MQPSSRHDGANSALARHLDRWGQEGTSKPRWLTVLVLASLLVTIWLAIYLAGGTHTGTPHLFYVAIVAATASLGMRGALTTAVIAATLSAQAPLDTSTGQSQSAGTIAVRTVIFLMVAVATSAAIESRRRADRRSHFRELTELIGPPATRTAPVDQALLSLLPQVLAERTFHPVFQPVYSLHSGDLLSVEALTRFDCEPYRSPDQWFAAAAHAGVGPDLELAAIEAAIAASASLPDTVSLSINASATTLADARLHAMVRATGRSLIVELTEHSVINNYHLLEEPLGLLRNEGVLIAVDDAGAGFASLHHIVELAPDVIKLDISLTQNVTSSPARRALGGALIDFVHRTGAMLTVEGIEDEADLAIWMELGADAIQGYLVGHPGPLPADLLSHTVISKRETLASR